jgi:hypothetical protein
MEDRVKKENGIASEGISGRGMEYRGKNGKN